ncbi:hypothetical protein [Myxococcus sp. CA040A]|uniref:hypothetical protein n=1 Tax=Myxococcus sp. CA040A TaxID=2741738 RepID=UPI00157AB6F6|nr:hypothetical protein [Myxococcus sp. CA040A]NTX06274.1 hypothetical protein [Myxococcus sp. CA040A]
MTVERVGSGGSSEAAQRAAEAAARRAAEEAARRAAEAARQAAEAARQAAEAARQAQEAKKDESTFEAAGAKNTLNLDGKGSAPATSLFTENSQDGKVNCLDKAADFVSKSSPELQGRSDLVFLKDSRTGAEGQAGHVVVRQGERVLDPSNGKSYEDMKSYLKEQPHYSEAGSIPGTTAAKILATEAGSPERAQALSDGKVSPELRKMMVADPTIPSQAPDAANAPTGSLPLPPLTVPVGKNGSVGLEFSAELDKKVKKADGYTTVELSAEMSVGANAELDMKKVTVGGGVSRANTQTYEVKMKDEDFEKLKQGKIAPPHPLKPETIPNGASVKMDAAELKGFSYNGSVDVKGVDLGLGEEIQKGRGVSFETSKDDKGQVTVTAGPTDLIKSGASVSVGAAGATVSLNGSTELTDYKMRTATFDVNTKEGKDAFEQFAKTKQLPEKDGAGVSDSATVDKLELSSDAKVKLELGPLSKEFQAVPENGGSITITTKGDGSRDTVLETQDADGTRLDYKRSFDKDGKEVFDKDKFEYKMFMEGLSGGAEYTFAQQYNVDQHDFDKKKDIELTFSGDQLTELADRARDFKSRWESHSGKMATNQFEFVQKLANAKDPAEVAEILTLTKNAPRGLGGLAEDLGPLHVPGKPLPGDIQARHRDNVG